MVPVLYFQNVSFPTLFSLLCHSRLQRRNNSPLWGLSSLLGHLTAVVMRAARTAATPYELGFVLNAFSHMGLTVGSRCAVMIHLVLQRGC